MTQTGSSLALVHGQERDEYSAQWVQAAQAGDRPTYFRIDPEQVIKAYRVNGGEASG